MWRPSGGGCKICTIFLVIVSLLTEKSSCAKSRKGIKSVFMELLKSPRVPDMKRGVAGDGDVLSTDIPVGDEVISILPMSCTICRLLVLDVCGLAVSLGRKWKSRITAKPMFSFALPQACSRLTYLKVFGVVRARRERMVKICSELVVELGQQLLTTAEAVVYQTVSALAVGLTPPAVGPLVNELCKAACESGATCASGHPLPRWGAVVEALLGHEPIANSLLDVANLSSHDEPGTWYNRHVSDSLLHFAVAKFDSSAVRLIMAVAGASVSTPQHVGNFALLHESLVPLMSERTQTQQLQEAEYYIRRGGDVYDQQYLDFLGLRRERLLKMMCSRRFSLSSANHNDSSLHVAAFSYDHDALAVLLLRDGAGPHVDAKDADDRTPLHYASDSNNQIAGFLYAASISPLIAMRSKSRIKSLNGLYQENIVREFSDTQLSTVQVLLDYRASVDSKSRNMGTTPLHYAARSGTEATVVALLEARADPNLPNKHKHTALTVAALYGHARICEVLISSRADVTVRDAANRSISQLVAASAAMMTRDDAKRLFGVDRQEPLAGKSAAEEVSEDGAWRAMNPHQKLPKWGAFASNKPPDLCEFDRRPSNLSSKEFVAEYLTLSRPVIVQGVAKDWPAKRTWAFEEFLTRWGEDRFNPQKFPQELSSLINRKHRSLRSYFDAVKAGKYDIPAVLNTPVNASRWLEMQKDLKEPPVFGRTRGGFDLFLGPKRAGLPMHYHRASWSALLYGLKLWVLTPPSKSRFFDGHHAATFFEAGLLQQAEKHANGNAPEGAIHFCVQHPDDALFIPHGWGHATVYLKDSISVTKFFQDDDAIPYHPEVLFTAELGMRSLQTAAALSHEYEWLNAVVASSVGMAERPTIRNIVPIQRGNG